MAGNSGPSREDSGGLSQGAGSREQGAGSTLGDATGRAAIGVNADFPQVNDIGRGTLGAAIVMLNGVIASIEALPCNDHSEAHTDIALAGLSSFYAAVGKLRLVCPRQNVGWLQDKVYNGLEILSRDRGEEEKFFEGATESENEVEELTLQRQEYLQGLQRISAAVLRRCLSLGLQVLDSMDGATRAEENST